MIRTEHLSFQYGGGKMILDDISLDIGHGEFIAILGGNGAGKTTLVKHFNALLKPTSGSVIVDGVDTKEARVYDMAQKVALIFQNPDYVLFRDSVRDELKFGLKNFGLSDDKIWDRILPLMETFGLDPYLMSPPLTLSGGERKRLSLACALAWNPDCIILDEPTIGQDYKQKSNLKHLFNQLNESGKTVIITSHDMEFIAECKPRIIVMKHGKVIADAGAEEVLTDAELMSTACLASPQICRAFSFIDFLKSNGEVLSVSDAKEAIVNLVKGADSDA